MKTIANMVTGDKLTPEDQKHVLAAFVHRFTGEHRPDWARKEWKNGQPYPLQFKDDAEWLANTRFAVRRDGRIDQRVQSCECNPTWPNNPELRFKAA